MSKTSGVTGLIIASLAAVGAAQTPSQHSAINPVGAWRGTSVCLVHPSACHDEIVVYQITHARAVDSLSVDARKIVGGEEQDMGVLTCKFTSTIALITCVMPQGTWQFRLRGDSLVGELRLPNNAKFREVRAARVP